VGGFLVVAAAILVVTAWLDATRSHDQQWVVASTDLAAGTTVRAGDLTTEGMALPASTTGAEAFHSAAGLVGRTLAAPLLAGELVQQSSLVASGRPPALRPVTISVDATDTEGLTAGTLVDLLVTDGSDPKSPTQVVVRGATLLQSSTPSSSILGSSSTSSVTLGVSSLREVEAIVHAAHTGSVSIVVGERSDGRGLGAA
jgi:Flp pilus assembly protein CpaB